MENSRVVLAMLLIGGSLIYAGKGNRWRQQDGRDLKVEMAEPSEWDDIPSSPAGVDYEHQSWGTPKDSNGDWVMRLRYEQRRKAYEDRCEKIRSLRLLSRENFRKFQECEDFDLAALFEEK